MPSAKGARKASQAPEACRAAHVRAELIDTGRSPISIRPAEPRDASGIALLISQMGYPATADDVHRRLRIFADGRSDVLVALSGNGDQAVIGLVSISLAPSILDAAPTGRITALMVSREYRRSGVGRLLLERVEVWARNRGCDRIHVVAGKRRVKVSHPFYSNVGFESETGTSFIKRLT